MAPGGYLWNLPCKLQRNLNYKYIYIYIYIYQLQIWNTTYFRHMALTFYQILIKTYFVKYYLYKMI